MLPPALSGDRVTLHRRTKTIGDAFFMTTVAREIRRHNPSCAIDVLTHWPTLFENNPDIATSQGIRESTEFEGVEISYEDPWPPPRNRHVLRTICDRVGLDGDAIDVRTYYYPTEEERKHAEELFPDTDRPVVVIHPFSGFFAPRTKQWDFGNWKTFLETIPYEIETLRFSIADDPATPAERPFHREIETNDIRLMVALMERADAFIGHDSGLAHLATSIGKPAVVIFTGFVPPDVFGYTQNVNLAPTELSYVPCWQSEGCDPCRGEKCTKAVTPEQARDALLEVLGQAGIRP